MMVTLILFLFEAYSGSGLCGLGFRLDKVLDLSSLMALASCLRLFICLCWFQAWQVKFEASKAWLQATDFCFFLASAG